MVEADKALVERLKLHKSWRDSHGELNNAPSLAAARIEAMADEIEAAEARGYAKAIEDAAGVARCFAAHAAMTIKDKDESAASVAVAAVRGNVAAAVHIAAAIRALAGKDEA